MFDLIEIDSSHAVAFSGLTFPRNRERFFQIGRDDSARALGASIFAAPVGLVYATFDSENARYLIESLYVKPKFRNRGIGTALLRGLEDRLRAEKACETLHLSYLRPDGDATCPCDSLVGKLNWAAPKHDSIFVRTDERYRQAPWYMAFRFSPSYQFCLWAELTTDDKNALRADLEREPCQPEYLSPFVHEERIETLNSIGLKHEGRIVGWMLTERLNADTILYGRAYVIPKLQRYGKYLFQLVSEAVEYSYQHRIYQGVFSVSAKNTGMRRLLYTRMRDYVIEIRNKYYSYAMIGAR